MNRQVTTIAVAAALAIAGPAAAQSLIIKTGPQGGVWYPVAAGMAGVLQDKAGMTASVQTGGGISNAITVGRNEGQIGFTTSSAVKEVYDGADGRPPEQNLRLLGVLYNQYYTLTVQEDSPIQSVADLEGRSMVTLREGSSTEEVAQQVLEVNGLTYDDLSQVNFAGSVGDAAEQLQNGRVDAFATLITHPASFLLELGSATDVRLIALTEEATSKLVEDYIGYTPIVLEAGTYPWQEEDIPTVNSPVMLVTNTEVPDDVVYEMTKALFENQETLTNVHQVMAEFTPENAAADPIIPIHPGALRYYEEVGVAPAAQ